MFLQSDVAVQAPGLADDCVQQLILARLMDARDEVFSDGQMLNFLRVIKPRQIALAVEARNKELWEAQAVLSAASRLPPALPLLRPAQQHHRPGGRRKYID